MSRFFAKLVSYKGEWAVNLLEFEGPTITQYVTVNENQQTAIVTDFSYNATKCRLSFKVNGRNDSFEMHEIPEATGRKLLEPHNWKNLCYGLKIKSDKTFIWLTQKGILPGTE